MKITSVWFCPALAVAILCGVAGFVVVKRKATRDAASQAATLAQAKREARPTVPPAAAPPGATVEERTVPQDNTPPPEPVDAGGQSKENARKASAGPNTGGRPAKEPLKDPVARIALASVGADPAAEAYWFGAINDPGLSAHERQDLIEDLNEDGLSDPKHPTVDDLPLILNRLMIIEEVGLDAMDHVNADAFQEAYKDLVNLANLVMGGGEPVK